MGWHQNIYGTNTDFKKITQVKLGKDFKELFFGLDANISPGRTIFINALFTNKDIIPDIVVQYPSREENFCGYQSTKSQMIANFTKWSVSKTNLFKDHPFYNDYCKYFLSRMNSVLKQFSYYFYNDSMAYDVVGEPYTEQRAVKFLKSSVKFYDDIRNNKVPNGQNIKDALSFTFFTYKNNKIQVDDNDLRKEAKEGNHHWLYFGN